VSLGSIALKAVQYFGDIDFVLSLGNTGVAEMLNGLFGWPILVICGAAIAWCVYDSIWARDKRYSKLLSLGVASVASCMIGFLLALVAVSDAPPQKIIAMLEYRFVETDEVPALVTHINTARLQGLRRRGDRLITLVRGDNDAIDAMTDDHVVKSQPYTIPQDALAMVTELPQAFLGGLPRGVSGVQVYVLSLPLGIGGDDVRRVIDAERVGGRILADSRMGARIRFGGVETDLTESEPRN
jgi:hypothetical protein